ncbi:iron complex transport system permease protein [Desulfitobacterium sp. LBE]|uniref:Transport system permease protein n=1 Tax=Desulfitobacterium hafniense (strain DSM 10664 / DCB-2) TaxID=272564 RepID=B8G1N8_DESHD|nr:transport system permease protein [Desulfitobacterium hafniense DCB-2]TWH58662.1 iron complex transport system permease protein [Desulfitobacterium sp. LBE]
MERLHLVNKGSKLHYREAYGKYMARKRFVILVLIALLLGVALFSITAGSAGLTLGEVFRTFMGTGTAQAQAIVWNVRLPRILTAIVVGGALALAGCVMQSVLRNPLASSSTLGISHGAAFGAAIAIVYFSAGSQHNAAGSGAISITNPYLVTACAFMGGMISVFVILVLSRIKTVTPAAMVLAGVALSSLFRGGVALVQYFADDVALASAVYWTFGDLGRTSWHEIGLILIILGPTFVYFMFNSWSYNGIQSGSQTARSLGIHVDQLIIVSMVLAALLAASAVSFVGIIDFVGLVAPHMVRKFVGSDYRFLLPASMLAGACILLLSDLCSRTIIAPIVLPIGAITSFLGAPLFIYLIYKGAKK